MQTDILSCGHKPSPHSHCTTGTAKRRDGSEICWDCANREELQAMMASDKYAAYLSCDGRRVTTWPGGFLANVTHLGGPHTFWVGPNAGTFHAVRAKMADGSRWYGRAYYGLGGLVRLKRAKV